MNTSCLMALTTIAAAALLVTGCGGRASDDEPAAESIQQVELRPLETVLTESDGNTALTLEENPFEFAWDLQLLHGERPVQAHYTWMSPAVKNLFFIQVDTGEIHGIDIFSGITQWVTQPLPKLIKLAPFVHRTSVKDPNTGRMIHDDRLYVISGDQLFVFDCVYGQLIWSMSLGENGAYGFQPASGPFVNGAAGNRRVFIGDYEGRVQVIAFHEDKQRPYVRWQWNLMAVPTSRGNGAEDLTYIGDHRGQMTCFALDRERLWSYSARAAIFGSSVIRGGALYFGANDNILHVLNRLSGQLLGRVYIGAPIRRTPFFFNSEGTRLYVWTSGDPDERGLRAIRTIPDEVILEDVDRDYVKSIDVNRLAQEWFIPGISRLVASSPGHLYAMRDDSSVLLAIDRSNGTIDWHWDINAERESGEKVVHITEYADPTDEVRAVVTVDQGGHVICYRLFGAEQRMTSR